MIWNEHQQREASTVKKSEWNMAKNDDTSQKSLLIRHFYNNQPLRHTATLS